MRSVTSRRSPPRGQERYLTIVYRPLNRRFRETPPHGSQSSGSAPVSGSTSSARAGPSPRHGPGPRGNLGEAGVLDEHGQDAGPARAPLERLHLGEGRQQEGDLLLALGEPGVELDAAVARALRSASMTAAWATWTATLPGVRRSSPRTTSTIL